MQSNKFLEQIADYYTSPKRKGDLAEIVFIMPNKRSGMFLKRYIQQCVGTHATFMPRFMTLSRFVAVHAHVTEAERYDKLFTLYKAYRQVLEERNSPDQAKDFDRFIFWGDMILDDFDEIDRALADPLKLYGNLKDLKEITADYLTEEQKDIIRNIWGDTPLTIEDSDSFWLHASHKNDDNHSETKRKFIALWQILAQVYTIFRERLLSQGMATPGMQIRMAVKSLQNTPLEELKLHKYAFVGHSDLSTAEFAIMDRLKAAGCAEFFWDVSSPLFSSKNGKFCTENPMFRLIQKAAEHYPMPDDFELQQIDSFGQLDIVGTPSSVGQAKHAGKIITEMYEHGELEFNTAINTAIVMPETSLLTPLLLSMPQGLTSLNVTMSLPCSGTTFATLLRSIVSMQKRSRKLHERRVYYYEDILELLIHPHLQLIAGEQCERIRTKIHTERLFNIDATMLCEEFPQLDYIFSPVADAANLSQVSSYVDRLLQGLKEALNAYTSAQTIELQMLDFFQKSISELHDLIMHHGIEMQEETFFHMFERILNTSTIPLQGTPLQGLQIMGVLETRCLDFDNIIFLSLNERTFPRRHYVRTMIPNNIRRGYGLPTIEQKESFYAYYFYRAISRAKHATLIYDSRPANKGSREMSRYLTQLIYTKDQGNIHHTYVDYTHHPSTVREITVEKSPSVMKELQTFTRPGGARISASALKTYMRCPLAFYLQYVKGLREPDEPKDCLTASMLGDIFHHTMKRLYEPYEGKLITAEIIDELLNGEELWKIILEETANVGYNRPKGIPYEQMTAEAKLNAGIIREQVRYMLDVEKRNYCQGDSFIYIAGEKDIKDQQWEVIPGLRINFRMQIDRIDQLSDGHLRFIDYKTGTDDYKVGKSIENLFNGEHSRQAIFQLLLYAEAYNDMVQPGIKITPSLHRLRDIVVSGKIEPLTFNSKPMEPYPALSGEFRPLLNKTIEKIFDETTPFKQGENSESCKFCQFINMCGRNNE